MAGRGGAAGSGLGASGVDIPIFFSFLPPLQRVITKGPIWISDSEENTPQQRSQPSFRVTMKRKLDENEEPVRSAPETAEKRSNSKQQEAEDPSFGELGLDPRLVQALAKQNFEKPTPVQRRVIPLALDGQDVLAKAPCGSGKTAAYVLPLLSAILKRKSVRTFLHCYLGVGPCPQEFY